VEILIYLKGLKYSMATISSGAHTRKIGRKLMLTLIIAFLLTFLTVAANGYTVEIVSVQTTDMQGNPKTEFKRGEFVVVNVKIKSLLTYESQDYLLIVQVKTPDERVIALGFTSGSLAPGQEVSTGYGFKIPDDAPTGTYKVEIFVWNGWPAIMGGNWKPLSEKETTTITVTT